MKKIKIKESAATKRAAAEFEAEVTRAINKLRRASGEKIEQVVVYWPKEGSAKREASISLYLGDRKEAA